VQASVNERHPVCGQARNSNGDRRLRNVPGRPDGPWWRGRQLGRTRGTPSGRLRRKGCRLFRAPPSRRRCIIHGANGVWVRRRHEDSVTRWMVGRGRGGGGSRGRAFSRRKGRAYVCAFMIIIMMMMRSLAPVIKRRNTGKRKRRVTEYLHWGILMTRG
jgi:hypothetical protein